MEFHAKEQRLRFDKPIELSPHSVDKLINLINDRLTSHSELSLMQPISQLEFRLNTRLEYLLNAEQKKKYYPVIVELMLKELNRNPNVH